MSQRFWIVAALLVAWGGGQLALAKLPEKYEIIGLRLDSLRSDGVNNLNRYNFDTEEMFHPYLTESVNAILQFYKSPFELKRQLNASGQEPTADAYINTLRENRIIIYKMPNVQGRVLRVILNNQVPVLAFQKIRTTKQNLNIMRIQSSVISLYRMPNFTQSSKKISGDIKYEFVSTPGRLTVKTDFKTDWSNTWTTPDIENIGLVYDYLCVVTCPEMSLKTIKDKINNGLSDVGFEYKVPDFAELKGENLTY